MIRILLSVLLGLFVYDGFCCTCAPMGKLTDKEYQYYDLIIKGKVINIESNNMLNIIIIEVKKMYKGNIEKQVIKIYTPAQAGMCGIFPKKGERWLFFANWHENNYYTDLCTRTKGINSKATIYKKDELKEDIKFLKGK